MNKLSGNSLLVLKKLSYVTYFEVFIVQYNDKCDNSIQLLKGFCICNIIFIKY